MTSPWAKTTFSSNEVNQDFSETSQIVELVFQKV